MLPQFFRRSHRTKPVTTAGKSNLTAADFDPYDLEERPLPPPRFRLHKRQWFSHLFGWPAAVILGQLVLQGLGWGFFAAVKYRQQIILPFSSAVWVKNNTHSVTLITTLIATFLAGFSTLPSDDPCPSIYMNQCHSRLWGQVWSTLITPVVVVVSTPLVGSEVDLASPNVQQFLSNASGPAAPCLVNGTAGQYTISGEAASGLAAATSHLGHSSMLTALDQTFNSSTGGILPTHLADVNTTGWFTLDPTILHATTQNTSSLPLDGLSTNYSMSQQGFTADVSCTFVPQKDLHINNVFTDTVTMWNHSDVADMTTIKFIGWTSNCPSTGDSNSSTVYTDQQLSYVMLNACDPATAAPNNYTLLTIGGGDYLHFFNYSFINCQFTPQFTKVRAEYSAIINAHTTGIHSIGTPVAAGGVAGSFAVQTLGEMVFYSQGLYGNTVGDHFVSLLLSTNETDKDRALRITEKYYQGVAEYSGTLLRTCISSSMVGGVPSNMIIPTNGTYYTETMGWTYTSGSTRWILVPSTVIAFSTIAIVLVALYRHGGEIRDDKRPFDPSNPMHLMAAAAAGGLTDAFRGIEERDIKDWEKLNVVLGSIPGRGPALVRADEYRSLYTDPFSHGQLTPGSRK
ncbi:hypothetical protein C8J57DRAFT_1239615 [Mycena rebaudengoi]|nr:hypothetical protein C8J57DRAFT_1239615 [Mycena rebaudengoi]